jgi:hypothetical protein
VSKENVAASAPVHQLVGRIFRATYNTGRFMDSTWYVEWADNYLQPIRVDLHGKREPLFGYTINDCAHYLKTGAWIPFDPPNVKDQGAGK